MNKMGAPNEAVAGWRYVHTENAGFVPTRKQNLVWEGVLHLNASCLFFIIPSFKCIIGA